MARKSGEKIRMTATSVEMAQILGDILRNHLKLNLWHTECWTFEHVADYEIKSKEDRTPETDFYGGVEHEVSVYLGEGYVPVMNFTTNSGKTERVDLRIRCEHSKWVPASMSYWAFQLWLRSENGETRKYTFECYKGYGQDRSIYMPEGERIPAEPPKRIKF